MERVTSLKEHSGGADALAAAIAARRLARLQSAAHAGRQDHPRASNIGDCDLEIYHQVVDWDRRPLPPPDLQARFEEGIRQERAVIGELVEMGFDVRESQRPFEIKDRDGLILCTGHIDGMIHYEGENVVFEVKSLDPNVFARIDSVADFQRYTWARRYPRQIMLYLYARGDPHGLFVVTDCKGHWKLLPVNLEDHLDECESLLQRLRRIVLAIRDHDPGRLMPCGDPEICRGCWCMAAGLCQPDLAGAGQYRPIDDVEIAAALDRMAELAEAADEYRALEKRVKDAFKAAGEGLYIAGDWLVEVRQQQRRTYKVPEEIRAKYASSSTAILVKWKRLV